MIWLIFKIILRTILTLISAVIIYLAAAYTLPYITVNNSFKNETDGIKIYVSSNGVHTDIIVPINSKLKDWRTNFPAEKFDVKDSAYNHLSFGWGDKGFYLDTPTWDDLTVSTAVTAALGLGETAMHVTYRKQPKLNSKSIVCLTITQENYEKLINYIENSFEKKDNAIQLIEHPGYGNNDRFYEALGSYSAFKTCNIWTNQGLKKIGVKVAVWSPAESGLMRSLKQ